MWCGVMCAYVEGEENNDQVCSLENRKQMHEASCSSCSEVSWDSEIVLKES